MYIDDGGHFPKRNNFIPRKPPRHGSEKRRPSGDRERNVGHPNGEEHSRVPKGNKGPRIGRITYIPNFNNQIVIFSQSDLFGYNLYTFSSNNINNQGAIDYYQDFTIPNVESFPSMEVDTEVVVVAVVATAIVLVCVVGAFFTGGQSLFGLLALV